MCVTKEILLRVNVGTHFLQEIFANAKAVKKDDSVAVLNATLFQKKSN